MVPSLILRFHIFWNLQYLGLLSKLLQEFDINTNFHVKWTFALLAHIYFIQFSKLKKYFSQNQLFPNLLRCHQWNYYIFVPKLSWKNRHLQNTKMSIVGFCSISMCWITLCDTILGNQSEVEHVSFSVLYLIELLI